MSEIEPLDRNRCQGERRAVNFMTLGGDPRALIRCGNRPDWAAYEIKYKRGDQGRMSLCQSCREIFEKQTPEKVVKNIRWIRILHKLDALRAKKAGK